MSTSLIIAAITESLRKILNDAMALDIYLPNTVVTMRSPDKARGSGTENQLNLFLYQVSPNAAWSNLSIPPNSGSARPPLALNLHYLITAYGSDDDTAGIFRHWILGLAMSALHDHPIIDENELVSIQQSLGGGIIGDMIEPIRITQQPLSIEEISKLWTTFQTNYRMSAAYLATVALIESTRTSSAPLPVLSRGRDDQGVFSVTGRYPEITGVHVRRISPDMHIPGQLGNELVIQGKYLNCQDIRVLFRNNRLELPISLQPLPGFTDTDINVTLPDPIVEPAAMTEWLPGSCMVSVQFAYPDLSPSETNVIPFAIAPVIALPVKTFAHGLITLNLTSTPRIRDNQRVSLLFGDRHIRVPVEIIQPTDLTLPSELSFSIPDVDAGTYVVRLRVDGIDSIPVKRNEPGQPLMTVFDPDQQVTVT